MSFSRNRAFSALGALPVTGKCDTTVGQIQQFINGAIKAGAWSPKDLAGPPLLQVTGHVDQWTQAGLDALVPNWQIKVPMTIWRELGQKFDPDSYPFFTCQAGTAPGPSMPGPPGPPTPPPGLLAGLGNIPIALAVGAGIFLLATMVNK